MLDNAFDGIATRPAPGEYVMLKDREKPEGEIVHQLEQAAEQLDIPRSDLGLETATLALEKLGRDLRATRIARAMSELVEDSRDRQDDWGERVPPKKPWLKPAMAAAVAGAALLGLLLFLI